MGKGSGGRRRAGMAIATTVAACMGCSDVTGPPPVQLGRVEGEGVLGKWVHSGLYDRTYTLHLPPESSGSGPRPLLIVLHGAGDTGASFRARIEADRQTDAAGLVTVYPDGIGGTWAAGCRCTAADRAGVNDVIFLNTLVRHLAEGISIDTTRVYLAGYSQGGQLAQRYGCFSTSPPAGIASVAASLFRDLAVGCSLLPPFPVILIHGDADPIMLYDGFGVDASILSAEETLATWVTAMGCDPTAVEEQVPDANDDGTSVTISTFGGCQSDVQVEFDRVNGGGHTWPGKTGPWPRSTGKLSRNLDATDRILALFTGGAQ